jgi:putative transposase
MVHRASPLAVTRQCRILTLSRSSIYYGPVAIPEHDPALTRRIDEIHLKMPFLGSRRILDLLRREGYSVNRKKIRRLMRRMGICALYPKRRTTLP